MILPGPDPRNGVFRAGLYGQTGELLGTTAIPLTREVFDIKTMPRTIKTRTEVRDGRTFTVNVLRTQKGYWKPKRRRS